MSNLDLLPPQVADWFWNYGWINAVYRVQQQQKGADSANAFNYYSAVLDTMNAINGETVPAVPAFGSPGTKQYAYAQKTVLPIGIRWARAEQRKGFMRLSAKGLLS